ncbi:hypothetical protein MKW98_008222 [Papaver atlanticum]|uniref:Uncharacterized protein n=1 Tax=Papaver atlanticum TaxID=357466 RepID=A0AAD4RW22_9MAGN|nr:hypothetical protein MKW98_008222 [Papaver atlanticum]
MYGDMMIMTFADYSFFINCGGLEITVGGEKYDADLSQMGPSSFFSYNDRWACSNTGDFVGSRGSNYFTQASPNMSVAGLYKTARILFHSSTMASAYVREIIK